MLTKIECRTHLSNLPHLLPKDQHRLLRHLSQPGTRLCMSCRRILEFGALLRERCQYNGCKASYEISSCKPTIYFSVTITNTSLLLHHEHTDYCCTLV